MCAACGSSTAPVVPATGIVLLDLTTGSQVASLSVGSDPVAIALSEDGAIAYVADSAPGDVYAVKVSARRIVWRSHTGGAPFGVLAHAGRVFVSLYTSTFVDELDAASGQIVAAHHVNQGPAALTLDAAGRVIVAGTHGEVDYLDGTAPLPAGHGFGIAAANDQIWTADYERAELVRAGDLKLAGMPDPLFPFWLQADGGGKVLVAAEGDPEDTSPGGVYEFDPASGAFRTLARPQDPDQVVEASGTVFVAAHGDSDVLAIEASGATTVWARGVAAVGLATDPSMNLLVVAVNPDE